MDKHKKEEDFWLICPNWVEVLRFSKNNNFNDQLCESMYIDQGIVMGIYGDKAPLMKNRTEMEINQARLYWQKLVTEGWQPTEPKW